MSRLLLMSRAADGNGIFTPAHAFDDALEPDEVDLGVVVHLHAQVGLDGLDQTRRTAGR